MFEIPAKELEQFGATDREQCGIIIWVPSTGKITKVVEVTNIALDDEDYEICETDYLVVKHAIEGSSMEIFGFLHTHLPHHDPEPTDEDLEGAALTPTMTHCVYHPATGIVAWYANVLIGDTPETIT